MLVTDCLDRIKQIMDIKPLPEPEKGWKHQLTIPLPTDHVSFSYAGLTKALNEASLLPLKAENTWLWWVQAAEAKSTIASLIPRFWDVESGRILIGGVGCKEIFPKTLSDMVSFVFQDSSLLKCLFMTISVFPRPDATREEVYRRFMGPSAMTLSEASKGHRIPLQALPGSMFPAVREQRLNIARVMLKMPPILIFGRSNCFPDPDNETKIQTAFTNMSRGKTVLMIAHRLSTVTDTSRIFRDQGWSDGRKRKTQRSGCFKWSFIIRCGRHTKWLPHGKQVKINEQHNKTLQYKYALSENGAKDMVQAFAACTFSNPGLNDSSRPSLPVYCNCIYNRSAYFQQPDPFLRDRHPGMLRPDLPHLHLYPV